VELAKNFKEVRFNYIIIRWYTDSEGDRPMYPTFCDRAIKFCTHAEEEVYHWNRLAAQLEPLSSSFTKGCSPRKFEYLSKMRSYEKIFPTNIFTYMILQRKGLFIIFHIVNAWAGSKVPSNLASVARLPWEWDTYDATVKSGIISRTNILYKLKIRYNIM